MQCLTPETVELELDMIHVVSWAGEVLPKRNRLECCQVVDMRVAVVELAVVRLHFPVMARAGAIEFGVEKARRGKDIGVAIVVQPPGLHVADVHGPLGNEESLVIEAGASIQLGIGIHKAISLQYKIDVTASRNNGGEGVSHFEVGGRLGAQRPIDVHGFVVIGGSVRAGTGLPRCFGDGQRDSQLYGGGVFQLVCADMVVGIFQFITHKDIVLCRGIAIEGDYTTATTAARPPAKATAGVMNTTRAAKAKTAKNDLSHVFVRFMGSSNPFYASAPTYVCKILHDKVLQKRGADNGCPMGFRGLVETRSATACQLAHITHDSSG